MNETTNQILFFLLFTTLIGCIPSEAGVGGSRSTAKTYNLNDKDNYFNGKLAKKGIYMNYLIQVDDIYFPQ